MNEHVAGPVEALGPGSVTGAGPWVVVNAGGQRHALSRRCRHLRADLAEGHLDGDGCLVCPWHQARYELASGRMVTGPRGVFARVPGLGVSFKAFTRVAPLRRAEVLERDGQIVVRG